MLQKTKEFPNKRDNIYVNLITGQEGTIDQVGRTVVPSDRVNKRHGLNGTPKVRSNRKSTNGRNIYYQIINLFEKFDIKKGTGKVLLNELGEQKKRTIKHVQESYSAIQRKISLLDFYDKIEINKSKWHEAHPEYKCKNK